MATNKPHHGASNSLDSLFEDSPQIDEYEFYEHTSAGADRRLYRRLNYDHWRVDPNPPQDGSFNPSGRRPTNGPQANRFRDGPQRPFYPRTGVAGFGASVGAGMPVNEPAQSSQAPSAGLPVDNSPPSTRVRLAKMVGWLEEVEIELAGLRNHLDNLNWHGPPLLTVRFNRALIERQEVLCEIAALRFPDNDALLPEDLGETYYSPEETFEICWGPLPPGHHQNDKMQPTAPVYEPAKPAGETTGEDSMPTKLL